MKKLITLALFCSILSQKIIASKAAEGDDAYRVKSWTKTQADPKGSGSFSRKGTKLSNVKKSELSHLNDLDVIVIPDAELKELLENAKARIADIMNLQSTDVEHIDSIDALQLANQAYIALKNLEACRAEITQSKGKKVGDK